VSSSPFSVILSAVETLNSLFKVFFRQRIGLALLLGVIIFALAIVFIFLSFTPILSPFVYPLF